MEEQLIDDCQCPLEAVPASGRHPLHSKNILTTMYINEGTLYHIRCGSPAQSPTNRHLPNPCVASYWVHSSYEVLSVLNSDPSCRYPVG